MIKLKNKTALVAGGGKSGRAMAKFLIAKGARVIVSDTKKI
ncbi:MAG: short-chain dehydrogenase, partial [Elusimicrobia bacterium CG_4_10_14_3_um_filter_49_12_50_7]